MPTRPTIAEINLTTGEEILREMNDQELAQWEADKVEAKARAQAEANKAAEKAELLAKLGISEAEAKLLLS